MALDWARDNVSRIVGSIRRAGDGWLIRTESTKHPIHLALNSEPVRLPPCTDDPRASEVLLTWGRATIVLNEEQPDPIELQIVGEPPTTEPMNPPHPHPGEAATEVPKTPTDHERTLLAAKFLSIPGRPGDAIGDKAASELLKKIFPDRPVVTPRAIMDVVAKFRRHLQEDFAIPGIDGRHNINNLGRLLLEYGIISESDRLPPPPPDQAPGPTDT